MLKGKSYLMLPLQFLGLMWIVFVVDTALINIDLNIYGILPRTVNGLVGIPCSPFLHDGFLHITSNSFPLAILLGVTAVFFKKATYEIVLGIMVIGGGLVWLLGSSGYHVGASGLIYGLVGFLVAFGLYRKKLLPLIISLVIGLTYGLTMAVGVLPIFPGVSWEGHLFGAVAGVVTAKVMERE